MATPVNMPVLGLTMEEGTIAQWLKAEGDAVQKHEPLLLVETDKATVEVPSPASGVLQRIVVPPGQTVPVRALIAEIGAPGEAAATPPPPAATPAVSAVAAPPVAPALSEPDTREQAAASANLAAAAARPAARGPSGRQFVSPRARRRASELGLDVTVLQGTGPNGRVVEDDVLLAASAAEAPAAAAAERVLATPLAKRLADEYGLPLDRVTGSGPGGRITQDDVRRVAEAGAAPAADAAPATTALAAASAGAPAAGPAPGATTPLTRLRRLTAERMAASAGSVARVTLQLEADFSEAARFRQQLQPEFARLGVARLPWDALLAKAAGLALAEHPAVARQWVAGEGLRAPTGHHVGIAVALEPEGLVVPVLRDADTRPLRALAADLLAMAERARAGRLLPDEMAGGAFTITNLGAYRIDGFTPIVNPPETAILGVGRIADKPAVIGGQLAVRTQCTLSLSFDHRVVDGAPAAAFLRRLAELLERPYALLGI